jgi:hypothetical protein
MKILMLYNARSGTNSIASYFMKQNQSYIYFNQPWSFYAAEPGIVQVPYAECIKHKNVFIKNEFSNLETRKIEKKTLIKDFDKILLLARKDKREQAISCIIAQKNLSFLNKEKKKYFVDGLDETQIRNMQTAYAERELEMKEYLEHGAQMFYYEDLFYGEGFEKLFDFLGLKFIQEDFDEILDSKNRYKSGEIESKKVKTLI